MDLLLPAAHTPAVATDDELVRLYDYPDDLDRPWVKVNFISSADGAVSFGGRSGGLSDENDKRVFQLGRALADVILVGANTALIERYRGVQPDELAADLRADLGLARIPPIAVVTGRCSIEPNSGLITRPAVPTIVFTTEMAPADRRTALADAGADVVVAGDGSVDMKAVLADLGRRALRRVCCEGGPHLLGSLIGDDLVDELDLSIAPLLVSGDAGRIATGALPADARRMRLASVLHADDMLLVRYVRR